MIRGLGFRGAVALNIITMIGVGPLITIPLILAELPGPYALVAWVLGGLVALCDGLAYAELGSLFPRSGGTYVFLREAFGARGLGGLLAFLFAWQVVLSAPLLLASGYIGFAHYAAYLWPALAGDPLLEGVVAAAVGIITIFAAYQPIALVGRLGIALAGIALATLGALIGAAATHFDAGRAFANPHVDVAATLATGLGPALVITMYDYAGYSVAVTLGAEVRRPARVLPLSVIVSVALVGALFIALQLGVLGVIPWRELVPTRSGGSFPAAGQFVAATLVARTWGTPAASLITLPILVIAFASTFGILLAASRIPYAAAVDGLFLRPFARLHPSGRFPHVALLAIGLLALPACFLSLVDVINALTAGLTLISSIAQLAALATLRARGVRAPYRMTLYPLPALVALAGWLFAFWSSGRNAIAFGLLSLAAGAATFAWRARRSGSWPFAIRSDESALGSASRRRL